MPGTCRFSKGQWAVKLALHGPKFGLSFRMHKDKIYLCPLRVVPLGIAANTLDVDQPESQWCRI